MKATAPRERTATPAELEDDRRRCLAAKPRHFATVEDFERFCEAETDTRQRLLDGPDAAAVLTFSRGRPTLPTEPKTAQALRATYGKNGRPELPVQP